MSDGGDKARPIGDVLIDRGWRQGAMFRVPEGVSVAFVANTLGEPGSEDRLRLTAPRRVKARERCVVVTQTCDIKAAEGAEPTVEALICTVEKLDFVRKVGPNSARWFVIDAAAGLVAQAKYRVQITKQALATLTPEAWPGTPERLRQFVRWMMRRYGRPAVDDRIVEAFQRPVAALFDRLANEQPEVVEAFNLAVREVRITQPATEEPPFSLLVVLLTRLGGLEETEQRALGHVAGELEQAIDPQIVHVEGVEALSEEQMPVADYFATVPLYLEYFTYRGDEVDGAEPLGPA